MVKIKHVSYFCFADTSPADPLYKEAVDCAKFLASKGYVTINGGGPGSMRAVSEGAKAAGGTVIGVTFYPKDISNFEGRDPNNPIDQEMYIFFLQGEQAQFQNLVWHGDLPVFTMVTINH
jgi:predicted Rossmann-fold nucleotide-binding protein